MRHSLIAAGAVLLVAHTLTLAQGAKEPVDPIPPQVVIDDLRLAYSRPAADEITVRFRSGAGDRSDTYTVRIDPGPPGSPGPRRLLLELGSLRAYLEAGRLTAINTSAPDKVYIREFQGPITAGRLTDLLPPLPVPHLALVTPGDPGLSAPMCHLTGIVWSGAVPDESARPPTITMRGSSATGSIDVVALLPSIRLHRVSATVRRDESEATFDLSIRQVEPGDPAAWPISIEGRQRIQSLTELRPAARPLSPVAQGEVVPNLSLSRFDMTGWSLIQSLGAGDAARPLALILFTAPADAAKAQAIATEARAALEAVRSLHLSDQVSGQTGIPAVPKFVSAAAVVMELGPGVRERWAEVRRGWSAPGAAGAIGADELMWSTGAGESIDRFIPGAPGIVVVIRPDRSLAAAFKLDGRPAGELAADIRRALTQAAPQTK